MSSMVSIFLTEGPTMYSSYDDVIYGRSPSRPTRLDGFKNSPGKEPSKYEQSRNKSIDQHGPTTKGQNLASYKFAVSLTIAWSGTRYMSKLSAAGGAWKNEGDGSISIVLRTLYPSLFPQNLPFAPKKKDKGWGSVVNYKALFKSNKRRNNVGNKKINVTGCRLSLQLPETTALYPNLWNRPQNPLDLQPIILFTRRNTFLSKPQRLPFDIFDHSCHGEYLVVHDEKAYGWINSVECIVQGQDWIFVIVSNCRAKARIGYAL